MSSEVEYRVFERERDGEPYIFLVGTCLDWPDASRPILVEAHLPYEEQPHSKMPSINDYKKLDALRQRIVDTVCHEYEAVFVGHAIGARVIRVAFYAPREVPASVKVRKGLIGSAVIPLTQRQDPSWTVYVEVFQPSIRELQRAGNMAVLKRLSANGDRHELPREVDFFAYFSSAASRDTFNEQARAAGFEVGVSALQDGEDGSYGSSLTRVTSVEIEVITDLTTQLEELAAGLEGEFDGWGCPIAT